MYLDEGKGRPCMNSTFIGMVEGAAVGALMVSTLCNVSFCVKLTILLFPSEVVVH